MLTEPEVDLAGSPDASHSLDSGVGPTATIRWQYFDRNIGLLPARWITLDFAVRGFRGS